VAPRTPRAPAEAPAAQHSGRLALREGVAAAAAVSRFYSSWSPGEALAAPGLSCGCAVSTVRGSIAKTSEGFRKDAFVTLDDADQLPGGLIELTDRSHKQGDDPAPGRGFGAARTASSRSPLKRGRCAPLKEVLDVTALSLSHSNGFAKHLMLTANSRGNVGRPCALGAYSSRRLLGRAEAVRTSASYDQLRRDHAPCCAIRSNVRESAIG
jgi:hypothetical protein